MRFWPWEIMCSKLMAIEIRKSVQSTNCVQTTSRNAVTKKEETKLETINTTETNKN